MDNEAVGGATVPLDTLVPISRFYGSRASREFAKVADGVPVTVLKNGRPTYFIVTANDYRELREAKSVADRLRAAGTDAGPGAPGEEPCQR